ncbi:cholesterol 7-desaturase nvd-like [Ixodes scapularis]|uniref:cholesterol 7-desaturase nvd-like n=1 Tax=Ixodes scapularis TaxID=6945 RepID=UPI001C390463|nr:cholesterol 7-desaturase nvd-like [Ixodes scapularis]
MQCVAQSHLFYNSFVKKLRPVRTKFPKQDLPPVFPNGWFALFDSSALGVEQVRRVDVLGLELVAFRTKGGVAHVIDAYCPHLGAHLGVMGRVFGDCIECPFHGWRFRGEDGACMHVPYSAKAPEFVKVKTWETREVLGSLFMWYHADDGPPSWQVEDVREVSNGHWKLEMRYESILSVHIRDLGENEADLTHFGALHKPNPLMSPEEFSVSAGDTFWGRMLSYDWTADWHVEAHTSIVEVDANLRVFGKIYPILNHKARVTLHGPGCMIVQVSCKLGDIRMVVTITPEGPFQNRVVHKIYFEPRALMIFRFFVSKVYLSAFRRDILAWNHKTMHQHPPLQKNEKTVAQFRKWYDQFYSESSPTWQEVRDRTMQW